MVTYLVTKEASRVLKVLLRRISLNSHQVPSHFFCVGDGRMENDRKVVLQLAMKRMPEVLKINSLALTILFKDTPILSVNRV